MSIIHVNSKYWYDNIVTINSIWQFFFPIYGDTSLQSNLPAIIDGTNFFLLFLFKLSITIEFIISYEKVKKNLQVIYSWLFIYLSIETLTTEITLSWFCIPIPTSTVFDFWQTAANTLIIHLRKSRSITMKAT